MSKASEAAEARASAIELLRAAFPPGSTAKTILRHVSQSGMSRSISVIDADCEDVTYYVSRALGATIDQRWGGIKRGGCGMDMGFDLVYSLSRTLYPDGFDCIGNDEHTLSNGQQSRRCPSNDHSNREDHRHHADGGYAISQRWL